MAEGMRRPQEILPNPDPSIITTQQIDRAVNNLEEKIGARLNGIDKATDSFHDDLVRVPTLLDRSILGLRELLETRLKCMESDVSGVHKDLAQRGNEIKDQITHLHDLLVSKINELASVTAERFIGVGSQFAERDTRTDQRAGDTKLAVDAAFAAAKEATGKIEAGFTKQIDSMSAMIDTKTKNADDKITDLKDRLTALESRGAVLDPSFSTGISSIMTEMKALREAQNFSGGRVAQNKDNTATIIAIVAAVAAVVAIFVGLKY
jgi:hypothetical protein